MAEHAFLARFATIDKQDKEKSYHVFKCLGDDRIAETTTQEIYAERSAYREKEDKKIYNVVTARYHSEFNVDLPIISQTVPHNKSTWNPLKNDIESMKKLVILCSLPLLTHCCV